MKYLINRENSFFVKMDRANIITTDDMAQAKVFDTFDGALRVLHAYPKQLIDFELMVFPEVGQFTPGPWSWWANSLIGTAINGEKSHIVKCEGLTKANAHLIASAPAMFEALETMERELKRHGGVSAPTCFHLYQLAQATLRKARGQ